MAKAEPTGIGRFRLLLCQMIRLSTIVRESHRGVSPIGLAAVVVQEVIRVEVIAQFRSPKSMLEKSRIDCRSVSPERLSVPSPHVLLQAHHRVDLCP